MGYEFIPGLGYYKLHAVLKTWFEARDICAQEGAHLPVINSDREANALLHFWTPHPKIANLYDWRNDWAFIGFHDQFVEGEYVTIFGNWLQDTRYWELSSYKTKIRGTKHTVARQHTKAQGLTAGCWPQGHTYPSRSIIIQPVKLQFQHAVLPDLTGPWEVDMEQITDKCKELEYITILANISVKSWFQARVICEQEGAHLLIINSDREANALLHFWTPHPKIGGYTDYRNDWAFIGFHDQFIEGEYVTIFGKYY
ncbi:hypothetical protein C0J52_12567 [Blattella germanica]|nr:hypothetical protein C0J52_12567 [Blattella germanica]